ncbi:uncharacterized protein LOC100932605 isoform X2 [Sarcophilus harrisii]|uniref:uncharacterized protein LOC100932605 isoform X2 n=1 Tax=Sarcophilus harrisii TaxID=9305 RepID=UPI001301AD0C|nr:uncharacterized protein LOC100932605 isoform X2 [Sarcophilus harrisii]
MFITILHGDHEKTLFNSHCKVEALLNSIKQCCGCEPEGWNVPRSFRAHRLLSVSRHLTGATHVFQGPEGSSEPVFVALLKDDEVIDSKFLEKNKQNEMKATQTGRVFTDYIEA